MICTNCKANIKDNSKFCIRCGEIFYDYLGSMIDDSVYSDLMKIYTENKSFNIFSVKYFFFNFIYAFYKKMYFIGVCSLINSFVFKMFLLILKNQMDILPDKIGLSYMFFLMPVYIICFSVFMYFCFNFNKKYIEKAYYYVTSVVRENENEDYSYLRRIVEKKIRPNKVVVFLSIIAFILLIFI